MRLRTRAPSEVVLFFKSNKLDDICGHVAQARSSMGSAKVTPREELQAMMVVDFTLML
jgi:hypothetical protein